MRKPHVPTRKLRFTYRVLTAAILLTLTAAAQPMPTIFSSPGEKQFRGDRDFSDSWAGGSGGGDMVMRPADRRREGSTSFSSSGTIGSLGPGVRASLITRTSASASTSVEWSMGNFFMTGTPVSNIQGYTVAGSVVPVFLGARHELGRIKAGRFEWTQYAAAGAGPIMGIIYPNGGSFWSSIALIGFRWGAGAYAGLGSNLRFPNGFAINAQIELDGYGFLTQYLGRKSYLGPSFSFAFQFGG